MYHLTGGLRRRFRDGYVKEQRVSPEHVVKVVIDCPPICVRFARGDRLHLQVESACTPAFAPHLNTLEPLHSARRAVVARNRVWHTQLHNSHVAMPTVRAPR